VFEATIALEGASWSISANSPSFTSILSGAASMMNCASCSASARLAVTDSLPMMAVASLAATFPSSTPFVTIDSMASRPLAIAASDTSYMRAV
jgi:hypothetical protein